MSRDQFHFRVSAPETIAIVKVAPEVAKIVEVKSPESVPSAATLGVYTRAETDALIAAEKAQSVLDIDDQVSALIAARATIEFPFMTPVTVWDITHNLGRIPVIRILDTTGDEISTDIHCPDLNTVTATFAYPTAGKAYIS